MKSIDFISFRENARERPRHSPEPPRLSFVYSAVYVECHGAPTGARAASFCTPWGTAEDGTGGAVPAPGHSQAGGRKTRECGRGRSRFSRSLQRRSIEAGPNPLKSPLLRE